MGNKIIRDPLYNYIALPKDRPWIREALDSPEFQRLRRIHQLGVSNFTYPGADHNRLAHSLGVLHLMEHVLCHLEEFEELRTDVEANRDALLGAALLHDVGHGPFSHLFEPCLGIDHEEWSVRIISENTHLCTILERRDRYLPSRICDLIKDKPEKEPPLWQKALISSQLDVDRIDYLRRDSLFTGSGYGTFDWYRLLNTLQPFDSDGIVDLVWPTKAALGIEEYVFARYYMYQNVYLHKTTRGFECLLQEMWRNARELHENGDTGSILDPISSYWSAADPTVDDYMRIEEFTVLEQMQIWKHDDHPVLSDLSRRFLCRDGLAKVDPPQSDEALMPQNFDEWETALVDLVKREGFEFAESYVLQDKVKAKYKRPYISPEKEAKEQSIRNSLRVIPDGEESPIEISEFLPRLKGLTGSRDQISYYVPKEVRESATKLSREWKA